MEINLLQEPEVKRKWLFKLFGWKAITLITITAMVATAIPIYILLRPSSSREEISSPDIVRAGTISTVNALGRLEPAGEVIRLSTSIPLEGARIAELYVQEGDQVSAGQVIAVFDNRDRLLASLEQAKKQVSVAEAKLTRVRLGAQVGEIEAQTAVVQRLEAQVQGEIQAQNAEIARLRAQWRNAQAEYHRYQQLYSAGAISQSLLDSKKLVFETLEQQVTEASVTLNRIVSTGQAQITEAKAKLQQLRYVLPADVEVSQAELANTIAAVRRAEAELELAHVRSPLYGQVLKIHARPGELVGQQGIAELGQTQQMYVALITLKPNVNPQEIIPNIRANLPNDIRVLTKQEFVDFEKTYWANSTPIGFIFSLGVGMGFIVGAVIVYQVLYTEIADHLSEYATLKAMGYSHRYLLEIVFQEALILALVSYTPGFLISSGLYHLTKMVAFLPIAMTVERAVLVLGLTIAMCSLSGAIAVSKLKSADPADIF